MGLLCQRKREFYVGPDRFVVRNVFLSVLFGGSLVTIKMGRSTRSRLDVSAFSGLSSVLMCVLPH